MAFLKSVHCLLVIVFVFSIAACDQSPNATRGFRLPAGDVAHGAALFDELQCLACHSVAGKDDGTIEKELPSSVPLGGKVAIAKTYADLLTSVINPSHHISGRLPQELVQRNGESLMRNYNDIISVTELIDLVTYLETLYQLEVPEQTKH